MKNNKKSQIPATLTWIMAFVIIFFMMMIFLAAVVAISASKKSFFSVIFPTESVLQIKPDTKDDLSASSTLMEYVNSPIEYNGESKTMQEFTMEVTKNEKDNLLDVETMPDEKLNFNFLKQDKKNDNFLLFYDKTAGFFDSKYDVCYVLCIFKKGVSGRYKLFYPVRVVGGWCPLGIGALGPGGTVVPNYISDIYGRQPTNYDCAVLAKYPQDSDLRLYEKAEILPLPDISNPSVEIKLFIGGQTDKKIIPVK
jgi:hypothetical protein